ncbi:MAG: DUF4136 domain-containing protein [Pseudomonadota bacterium]
MNKTLLLVVLSLSMLMTGCAGLRNVTSEVSSYGSWPTGRAPGQYVFERLPSQQANTELQAKVEAAAVPALSAAGFKPAAMPDQADVLVQVSAQEQTLSSPYAPYGAYGHGPYGRVGMGGWFGSGGFSGIGLGLSFEPPITQAQVDLLIRDRRSNQVLYETHAVHRRNGGLDERLLVPMFEAALKDFPTPAVSPRQVTVPLPEKN